MAIAARDISPVAAQVRVRLSRPLTELFITRRSAPSSTIRARSGGATTPLITAVMKRALIGSSRMKFMATPIRVATASMM